MTAAVRSLRQVEVDARLSARVEKLQRLIEAERFGSFPDDASSSEGQPRTHCYPPDASSASRPIRRPLNGGVAIDPYALSNDGKHRPLIPFPGYPNATISHAVEECIGLNMLGAADDARESVLRELQIKLTQKKRFTYVCITDRPDFSYFIQRGITFEYIGYLNRIADPHWKKYFCLDIALIKQKYGIQELVMVGDPKYAA